MNRVQAVKALRFEGGVASEVILVSTQKIQNTKEIKPWVIGFDPSEVYVSIQVILPLFGRELNVKLYMRLSTTWGSFTRNCEKFLPTRFKAQPASLLRSNVSMEVEAHPSL